MMKRYNFGSYGPYEEPVFGEYVRLFDVIALVSHGVVKEEDIRTNDFGRGFMTCQDRILQELQCQEKESEGVKKNTVGKRPWIDAPFSGERFIDEVGLVLMHEFYPEKDINMSEMWERARKCIRVAHALKSLLEEDLSLRMGEP